MPHTSSVGPRIYFETSGDPAHEPLVLINGLGAQMHGWRDGLVQRLVDQGLFVIRMDNRDVGLSDQTAEPGTLLAEYEIDDFPKDVCRVLDELGIASAHVVGESMGGAIAQRMAITQPDRTRSATLFYTAPGFDMAFVGDAIIQALAEPPMTADMPRDAAIGKMVDNERLTASTGFPFDEAWIIRSKEMHYDRGFHPCGQQRQASAMVKAGVWLDALETIRCPVAVIHGRADRLVRTEAAFELGQRIPDAELHIYPGMGHQVIPELWDEFVPIIMRTVGRARA
jgi:pimeloyl-ACP methyl ester carboxylesterase